ncbi:hypothetical protein PROVRETT_09177 [Providencia rettgeri DSM 1131]|nr:hypothetical protein PROVRETT_09177 [Providencia rettgeri DSM 1131]
MDSNRYLYWHLNWCRNEDFREEKIILAERSFANNHIGWLPT